MILLVTEKTFVDYCNLHVAVGCIMHYEVYKAVAVLSSSYVKAGQMIEVTAGVGAFSDASKPRITINGKEMQLNDGAALHRFTATGNIL